MGGIPVELIDRDDATSAEDVGGVRPRRRSLWALGALAMGYMVARGWQAFGGLPDAAGWFGVCQGLLAAALLTRGMRARVVLWLAVLVFAGGWYSARFGPGPADRVDVRLHAAEGGPGPCIATVHGVVLEAPALSRTRVGVLGGFARTPSSWSFLLRVRRLETGAGGVAARGVLRVSVRGGDARPPEVRAGELVRITGEYRTIDTPRNPGEPDRRLLALQQGVVGRLITTDASLVQVLRPAPDKGAMHDRTAAFIAWSRARAARALDLRADDGAAGGGVGRALLGAMLLGAYEPGLEDVDEAFRRAGLVHLVAISGFNLTLLAWAGAMLLRLTGDRGRLESLGVAAMIVMYLLIVPAESPVMRAGVMVLAFLVTEALGRRYDRLTLLGWIAVAVLLWRPLDLWSLGFQLSFGIVGVLLWLGRRSEDRLFGVPLRGVVSVGVPIGAQRGLVQRGWSAVWGFAGPWLRTACSATLLAWCTAAPVIIVHTGVFSPWAPLTGLLILPLASATLCAGYAALLIGFVWPAAGQLVAQGALAGADALASSVLLMDHLPGGSVLLPRVSVWWGIAGVGCVLFWFARARVRSAWGWLILGVVLVWLVVEVRSRSSLARGVALRVDTFAVGDGTCHLIRSRDEAMLWDCGSSHPGLGLRELPRAVRHVGAWKVRSALITHANLDHFICLPDVVEVLGIERVYVTRALEQEASRSPAGAPAVLLAELRARRVEILVRGAGDTLRLGDAACELLHPAPDTSYAEVNDTSFVGLFRVRAAANERALLMTGDIGPAAIGEVRELLGARAVQAMELPHHGSAKPEAIMLVHGLRPGVVLQSTGPQRVGDPRWDGVRSSVGEWGVTARDGALRLEFGHDGEVRFSRFR